jgi:hypothetical protein
MRELVTFLGSFVRPLLAGGDVIVGKPLRPRERDLWAHDSGTLRERDVLLARLRRAQLLVADPDLPDPDGDELSLWIGLHNLLVFDHPDRARVWARSSTWRRLEGATRTMLTLPQPSTPPASIVRHVSVGAFIELLRSDTIVPTAAGDVRYRGQDARLRRLRPALTATGPREESVAWLPQPHAAETERLVEDALRASPLTCLLRPLVAPVGWSPLSSAHVLRERGHARAVCHVWSSHKDWSRVGGAVMAALLPSIAPTAALGPSLVEGLPAAPTGQLALPGAVVPASPRDVGAVVGALVHLHLLKVLELDTRLALALGSRDPGTLAFLALPLLLPWLQDELGTPVPDAGTGAFESALVRRWTEYVDRLEELVPRSVVENLLSTLVPRVVQPS